MLLVLYTLLSALMDTHGGAAYTAALVSTASVFMVLLAEVSSVSIKSISQLLLYPYNPPPPPPIPSQSFTILHPQPRLTFNNAASLRLNSRLVRS